MIQIVESYKREVQAYLYDEIEVSAEKALPSVGPDLQEAFAMQRSRLKRSGLKLICKEASLKYSKQAGLYGDRRVVKVETHEK